MLLSLVFLMVTSLSLLFLAATTATLGYHFMDCESKFLEENIIYLTLCNVIDFFPLERGKFNSLFKVSFLQVTWDRTYITKSLTLCAEHLSKPISTFVHLRQINCLHGALGTRQIFNDYCYDKTQCKVHSLYIQNCSYDKSWYFPS